MFLDRSNDRTRLTPWIYDVTNAALVLSLYSTMVELKNPFEQCPGEQYINYVLFFPHTGDSQPNKK